MSLTIDINLMVLIASDMIIIGVLSKIILTVNLIILWKIKKASYHPCYVYTFALQSSSATFSQSYQTFSPSSSPFHTTSLYSSFVVSLLCLFPSQILSRAYLIFRSVFSPDLAFVCITWVKVLNYHRSIWALLVSWLILMVCSLWGLIEFEVFERVVSLFFSILFTCFWLDLLVASQQMKRLKNSKTDGGKNPY